MKELFKKEIIKTKTMRDIIKQKENASVASRFISAQLDKPKVHGLIAIGDIEREDFYASTMFESIDGYQTISDGTGSVSLFGNGQYINMTTGATSGSYAQLDKTINFTPIEFTWDRDRYLHIKAYFSDVSNMVAWIGIGYAGCCTGVPNTGNEWIGFVVEDKKLYVRTCDGNGNETKIEVRDLNAYNEDEILFPWPEATLDLEVKLVAGKWATFEWYDTGYNVLGYVREAGGGVLTVDTTIPSGSGGATTIFNSFIRNKNDEDKVLKYSYFSFWQQSKRGKVYED